MSSCLQAVEFGLRINFMPIADGKCHPFCMSSAHI